MNILVEVFVDTMMQMLNLEIQGTVYLGNIVSYVM